MNCQVSSTYASRASQCGLRTICAPILTICKLLSSALGLLEPSFEVTVAVSIRSPTLLKPTLNEKMPVKYPTRLIITCKTGIIIITTVGLKTHLCFIEKLTSLLSCHPDHTQPLLLSIWNPQSVRSSVEVTDTTIRKTRPDSSPQQRRSLFPTERKFRLDANSVKMVPTACSRVHAQN